MSLPRLIFACLLTFTSKTLVSALFFKDSLTIELPQGKVKGKCDWFGNQRKFLGIPYASVTERFQAPGDPPSWNGTLVADRGNIMCNQYSSTLKMPVGQEDCLVLNIFTPLSIGNNLLPVMVFIHGGGYYWGSNTYLVYNPRYFIKENVVFVTINYRLGAFGFLCLGLKEAPGNVGLKDQLAALKWIQNNIHYFGGDANVVTFVGESVGATSVHHLLLSPSADGLFHRAVMQSGTILMPQAFDYNPVESTAKVAIRLGYNTTDPNELLNIFKNTSANDIVNASNADQKNNVFAPYIFRPCKETAATNSPLITETPRELLKHNGLNIPTINGYNNKEGIYWAWHYDPLTLDNIKKNFHTLIPENLQFKNEDEKKILMEDVLTIYFTNKTVTEGLIEYFTDSLIAYPSTAMSESLLTNPNRTVHNYYFKYDSTRNWNKFLTMPKVPGACHGDELFYTFDPIIYSVVPTIPTDTAVIKTITKLWTNFAKTGIPSSAVNWPASSTEKLNFLEIDASNKMIPLPNPSRIEFWRNVNEKYGKP